MFLSVSVGQLLVCGHNIQIIHANMKCKAHFLLVLMVRFCWLSLNSHHKSKYSNCIYKANAFQMFHFQLEIGAFYNHTYKKKIKRASEI